jgi:hypothetical protein
MICFQAVDRRPATIIRKTWNLAARKLADAKLFRLLWQVNKQKPYLGLLNSSIFRLAFGLSAICRLRI